MKSIELDLNTWKRSGLPLNAFLILQLYVENRKGEVSEAVTTMGESGDIIIDVRKQLDEKYLTFNSIQPTLDDVVPTKDALALFRDNENIGSWIDDWRKKFPEGESINGNRWRASKPACLKKMKAFIKKHKITREDIFKATDNYLHRFGGDFTYCKMASNFIYKDNVDESVLLSEIEGLQDVTIHQTRERTI